MTTKLIVCATFDIKSGLFSLPFCTHNSNTAIRSFAHELANPQSPLHLYADDYQLFTLGEFDQSTGLVSSLSTPSFLISGAQLSLLNQQPEASDNENLSSTISDPSHNQ